MERRSFVEIAGGTIILACIGGHLLSDKSNFTKIDSKSEAPDEFFLNQVERNNLYLAPIAPSGHNTQPCFIKYQEPYH